MGPSRPGRRSLPFAVRAAAALCLAASPSPAPAQEAGKAASASDWAERSPGAEGPLGNDAWLPVSKEAERRLGRGDRLFAELSRAASREPPQAELEALNRGWIEVFEAWRSALLSSAPGDAVPPQPQDDAPGWTSPWIDEDGTAPRALSRRTEGVETAVLRRLFALPPERRRAWRERFEPGASAALQAARGSGAALAALERESPGTRPSALAAVHLAETELERGRDGSARAWLERAEHHARIAGDESLLQGIALRREAAEGLSRRLPPSTRTAPGSSEPWESAAGLTLAREIALLDLQGGARVHRPQPGRGPQSGIAFLEADLALIHATDRLNVNADRALAVRLSDGAVVAEFEPQRLLDGAGVDLAPAALPPDAPGWPALPATDGRAVVLVLASDPSALACVELEERLDGPRPPKLRWAWIVDPAGGRWLRYDPLAGARPLPEPFSTADARFEPGPLVHAGLAFAQVREGDLRPGESEGAGPRTGLRSSLVAIDLATGEGVWKRLLARGSDLARGGGRLGLERRGGSAGQPLARVGERIFAGTHLGAGVLLDACDGRIAWGFKGRRRAAEARGWSGFAPAVHAAGGAEPGLLVLWAAADSDRLYWLRGEPDLGWPREAPTEPARLRGLLAHVPHALGEGEILLGGDAAQALVLSRAGAGRALSAWSARTGGRFESPHLGPGESFTGQGLASARRALFATERGVYLLDRERELFLTDFVPVRSRFPFGGNVYARGARVLVAGPHAAWLFAVR